MKGLGFAVWPLATMLTLPARPVFPGQAAVQDDRSRPPTPPAGTVAPLAATPADTLTHPPVLEDLSSEPHTVEVTLTARPTRLSLVPGVQTGAFAYNGQVPGPTLEVREGDHPESPDYLGPGMPWVYWRFLADQELWDIAAYLKHGLKPVENRVPDSEGPPDFWRSDYEERLGPHPPPFPTANEVEP